MHKLSDLQIACIRQHVKFALHEMESEKSGTLNNPEYKLQTIEIVIACVLSDIVEALPFPVYEDVKRLLAAREQIWNTLYPSDSNLDVERSTI